MSQSLQTEVPVRLLTDHEVTLAHSYAVLAQKHDGTDPSFTTLLSRELQVAFMRANRLTPSLPVSDSVSQAQLRETILTAKSMVSGAQDYLGALCRQCSHEYVPRGESAVCSTCGHDAGWWCPATPTHLCEYDEDSEYCSHCHEPDERK